MRFVTYAEDGGDRVGVLDHDSQVHPLPSDVTMLDLLRHGALREAGEQALSRPDTTRALTEVRLSAPMTARINDKQIGTDHWSSMAFSFADMIAYASRGTHVRQGDIIGSGTCGGGCLAELWGRHGIDAHPPLQPGDVVSVTV